MAWTPMYLLREDLKYLNDWLNQEDEIAFLVSNRESKWIAKKQHDIISEIGTQIFEDGDDFTIPDFVEYNLWHIPSGQLPLIGGTKLKFSKEDWSYDDKIFDPWTGWKETRSGANPRIPYFGAGHPGVIHLEIKVSDHDEIPMSSFGWIGNHYKMIGNAADQTTEKFWNKLKRMIKKIGKQIPRSNATDGKKEIFAFPAAYKEIQNGRQCALNP
jgi:hypothetical protein